MANEPRTSLQKDASLTGRSPASVTTGHLLQPDDRRLPSSAERDASLSRRQL